MSDLVEPAGRSNAFAVGHMTLNAGLGAGGLLAAVVVDAARPGSFVLLYLADAATFLAAAVIVTATVPAMARPAGPPSPHHYAYAGQAGYRAVLRDRSFIRLWAVTALLVTVGYGQLAVSVPKVATDHAGLPVSQLGLVHAANTITVVACQLPVLRAVTGHRRTRAVMVLALLWSGSWLLILLAGRLGPPAAVLATLIAATTIFALGEVLLSPALPPLANDLAPPGLRGRYNGAFTLAYTTGFALGPLLAGALLDRGLTEPLLLALAALSATAVPAARLLERHLPASANRIPAATTDPDRGLAHDATPSKGDRQ